ncbi:hypothetical protein [Gilvibacter sediminis]|uniref:hypothetical protein n=1 Tax=Gilvibacter sediminis TaxID=379071 RepID=UPI00234FDF4F|nr:hypothetical protein [Gilvibacter sediminis]
MLLYGVSLITPMFFGDDVVGALGLAFGWLGIFALDPYVTLPWLANFLYFFNLLAKKVNLKTQIKISALTLVFGLFLVGFHDLPINEGGGSVQVTVGIGFLLWMSSFIVLLIGQVKFNKSHISIKNESE